CFLRSARGRRGVGVRGGVMRENSLGSGHEGVKEGRSRPPREFPAAVWMRLFASVNYITCGMTVPRAACKSRPSRSRNVSPEPPREQHALPELLPAVAIADAERFLGEVERPPHRGSA